MGQQPPPSIKWSLRRIRAPHEERLDLARVASPSTYAASPSLAPGGHSHPHPTGHVAGPTALHAADYAACSSKSARGAPSRTGQTSARRGSDRAAARSSPAKGAPVQRDWLHSAAWHAGLLGRGVCPSAPLRQPAHAERRVPSRAHSEPHAHRPTRGLGVRAAAARSARWAAGRATAPRCRTRLGARVPAAAPAWLEMARRHEQPRLIPAATASALRASCGRRWQWR